MVHRRKLDCVSHLTVAWIPTMPLEDRRTPVKGFRVDRWGSKSTPRRCVRGNSLTNVVSQLSPMGVFARGGWGSAPARDRKGYCDVGAGSQQRAAVTRRTPALLPVATTRRFSLETVEDRCRLFSPRTMGRAGGTPKKPYPRRKIPFTGSGKVGQNRVDTPKLRARKRVLKPTPRSTLPKVEISAADAVLSTNFEANLGVDEGASAPPIASVSSPSVDMPRLIADPVPMEVCERQPTDATISAELICEQVPTDVTSGPEQRSGPIAPSARRTSLEIYTEMERALDPRRFAGAVGREREVQAVKQSVVSMLTKREFGVVWISGGPGTGKSCVIRELIDVHLAEERLPAYRVAVLDVSEAGALRNLALLLFPDDADDIPYDERDLMEFFGAKMQRDSPYAPLIIIVEVPVGLLSSDIEVRWLRNFLHLPSTGCKMIFCVCNKNGPRRFLDWHSLVSRPVVHHLAPYSKFQLMKIFKERVREIFHLWAQAVEVLPGRVVNHIAGFVSRLDGDAGKFLAICQTCIKRKRWEVAMDMYLVARNAELDAQMGLPQLSRVVSISDSMRAADSVMLACLKNPWSKRSPPQQFAPYNLSGVEFIIHLLAAAVCMAVASGDQTLSSISDYFGSLWRTVGFTDTAFSPHDFLTLCCFLEQRGVIRLFVHPEGKVSGGVPLSSQHANFVGFSVFDQDRLECHVAGNEWGRLMRAAALGEGLN